MPFGDGRVFTARRRFARFGRFSDIGFSGLRVRSWLQAVTRHIVHYVGFTPQLRTFGFWCRPLCDFRDQCAQCPVFADSVRSTPESRRSSADGEWLLLTLSRHSAPMDSTVSGPYNLARQLL